MEIPNTPDELVDLNSAPDPYDRPIVNEVMCLLHENKDAELADYQAVAELCNMTMKVVACRDSRPTPENSRFLPEIHRTIWALELVEGLMESLPFLKGKRPD